MYYSISVCQNTHPKKFESNALHYHSRSDTHFKKNIAPTFNCRYLVQMYRKIQQYKFLKHFLARFILFILLSTIVQFCATFQCCPIFEFCPIYRILFILLPLPD